MKFLKRNQTAFVACVLLAVLCIAAAGVGVSYAYFTSYTRAEGSRTVHAGTKRIVPHEEVVENLKKEITLLNQGDHECYGRVRILCPSGYTISVEQGSAWGQLQQLADGEYLVEYNPIIAAGGSSSLLKIVIDPPVGVRDDFNVIIIEECVPVLYEGTDGHAIPLPPDWDLAARPEDRT